jgi:hypothetical protein
MTRDLTTRLAASAAGTAPPRRGYMLTAAQLGAVLDVALVVGRRLVDGELSEEPVPAPAALIGVLP